MALVMSTGAKNGLLTALVKSTTSGGCLGVGGTCRLIITSTSITTPGTYSYGMYEGSDTSQYVSYSGSNWAGAGGGIKSLIAPITPISPNLASANGTAASFIMSANNTGVLCGSVGVSGSGADMVLNSTSIVSGVANTITHFSFKFPSTNGTVRWNEALENALLNSLMQTGSEPIMANGGLLTIYSGTQPTLASDSITTQSALATITFATTDFGTASSGSIGLAASKASTYVAAGTATWARWTKGTYVLDMSVGTAGADAIVSSTTVASGSPPTLTSLTLSL